MVKSLHDHAMEYNSNSLDDDGKVHDVNEWSGHVFDGSHMNRVHCLGRVMHCRST